MSFKQSLSDFFSLGTVATMIAIIVGVITFHNYIRDRPRVIRRKARINGNGMSLRLESLGSKPDSIDEILFNGFIDRKKVSSNLEIQNSPTTLQPNVNTLIEPFNSTLPALWYTTITIKFTSAKCMKVRFRNADKELNWLQFHYEKILYFCFPSYYDEHLMPKFVRNS